MHLRKIAGKSKFQGYIVLDLGRLRYTSEPPREA